MKFFKEKFNNKAVFAMIATAFFFFFGTTQFTHADTLGIIGSFSSGAISGVAFVISYFLAGIFGIVVAIEAWLIGVVLNINSNILQTTLVQTGFSISLSLANLAFVLGIIVIAIATILRSNTYGIKQLLWKLVVMAVLVNFGLVIMSPIFAIGNSFTNYFLNCINPVAGGCGGDGSSGTSFNNFGTTMAAAFNPNNPFTAPTTVSGSSATALQQSGLSGSFNVAQSNGASVGQALVPLFGMVFTAIDLILIVVVLGGFIILLVIRYLYIAILAILLPIAWASWVFPSFSSHFKKWWDEFIRWTFFAPVVLFFVYLALLTMKQVGGAFDVSAYTTNNSTWGAINNFLTGAISPIISSFVQEILLGGLIVGGMIAANSMGIKMAGAMVEAGKKGGDAVKTWTANQSKKGGRAVFRGVGGQKAVTAMREGRLGGLQRVPGVGWLASRGASLAGRAAEPHLTNKDLVEAEKKKVSDNPETIKQNLKGNMNTEARFAHLAKLIEKGELDEKTMVGGQTAKDYLDEHEADVKNYGFSKSQKDADKAFGGDKDMRRESKAVSALEQAGTATPEEMAAAVKKLDDATSSFISKLQKSDIAKMNVNEMFDPKILAENPAQKAERESLLKKMATEAPQLVSSLMPKMKFKQLDKMGDMYREQLDKELTRVSALPPGPEQEKLFDKLHNASLVFERSLARNAINAGGGDAGGTPAPAAPAH